MFIVYRNLVFEDYQQKKLANTISLHLINPTPASIKSVCKTVCELRYDRKDKKGLILFFGKQEDKAGYLKAITRFETDKFKPLANFLKGKTLEPDEKNVELLAWLIDFDQRPYEFGKNYKKKESEGTAPQQEVEDVINEEEIEKKATVTTIEDKRATEVSQMTSSAVPAKRNFAYKKAVGLAIILLLLVGASSYWWLRPKQNNTAYLTGYGRCMYWNIDHYEAIACLPKAGYNVVPLDSVKLANFKKITTPDTITLNAIGSVWYTKRHSELEYFTADGYHPIEIQLRLKPITDYIIKKYILIKKPQ